MSTFGGEIEEIPYISVDRFDGDNFESQVYFLSHCHSDHMVGLSNGYFQNALIERNKFIYTSDVSRVILRKMYPLIQDNIKVLDMYKATMIMLEDKTISVMPLPAGHCPGSVMFLFESDKLILYTGDYRIHKNDVRKFKGFYNSMNEVMEIDKIYLDTTFFLKCYLTFPKRKDSLAQLCKIIREWTDKGNNYIVQLITSAKYGYEYLFNEVRKNLGMPVHVNKEAYQIYSIIPEMDNSVTMNGGLTQIHCSCGNSYQSICLESYGKEIRRIKISAFRWTQDHLEDGLFSLVSDVHYLCYSTHASYEEGVELIKFLKPKRIKACVKHDDPYLNLEMTQLLDECLSECNKDVDKSSGPKLFDTNCTPKDSLESENEPFDDSFGVLNSPPKESIEDLKILLKKHSGCFDSGGNDHNPKIESETTHMVQEEFNFDLEFGISASSSREDVGIIRHEVNETIRINKNNYDSTTELRYSNQFKRDEKTDILAEPSDKLLSDTDSFSKWILSSPSETNLDTEREEPNTDCLNEFEVKGIELKFDDTKINLMKESGETSLLKEIYFLEPSPPRNDTEKECITRKDDSDSYENGDLASVSCILDISGAENVTGGSSSRQNVKEDQCKDKEREGIDFFNVLEKSERNDKIWILDSCSQNVGTVKNVSFTYSKSPPPRKKRR